ncbi:hypothetical protein [Streptomyces indiaensis]|uniref:Uncharacterized protein n=1 Tax=Streptomyces indiaensis TaxID=284033 RepID=A0ABN3DL90_9ACTN
MDVVAYGLVRMAAEPVAAAVPAQVGAYTRRGAAARAGAISARSAPSAPRACRSTRGGASHGPWTR